MDGLLLTSEVLVGSALFIVLTILGTTFARRRLIARGKPLTLCALREPADPRWRFGFARYGTTGVEWFTLWGLSLRPARQWERTVLDIGTGQLLPPSERPEILIPSAWRVDCCYRQESFEIALAQAPYTALRSWLEAVPPGHNVNVA